MKIFGCNDSRHVRPLWTAEEMGLDYELEMLPFPPRFFKKEYLDTNILGTVPYLKDGKVRKIIFVPGRIMNIIIS